MTQTTNYRHIAFIAFGLFLLAVAAFFWSQPKFAEANPSQIEEIRPAATSTISYLNALQSTSTVVDTQGGGAALPSDSASLLLTLHASSAPLTTMNFSVDYSQDGKDWYNESVSTIINASTTFMAGGTTTHGWNQAASSTAYSSDGRATSSAERKLVSIPTPTRYFRINFFLPSGSTNAGIWFSSVLKRQTR